MAMAPEEATERANRARFCNQAMDMYIEHLVASYCTHSYHLFYFRGYTLGQNIFFCPKKIQVKIHEV